MNDLKILKICSELSKVPNDEEIVIALCEKLEVCTVVVKNLARS